MKKNRELTIITAYFDIGRGNFKGHERGNNKYINFFKFWARIKNNLVIYTEECFKDEIMDIRREFGLENRTKIVVIDDIFTIYPDVYKRMQEIEKDKIYQSYRYIKDNLDNTAKYDYVMFLKSWCMMDAVNKKYVATDMLAWLDFGFNHGGDTYSNELDFDFLWKYPFENKIYLSSIKKDLNKPIFQIVQNSEVYACGTPYMVPVSMMQEFYDLIMEAMNSLLDVGLIDDDQTLLLMAYRKKPELFKYDVIDWFLTFKKYGANHMKTTKKLETKLGLKDKLLYKYRVFKRNKKYLKDIKKIFLKDYLD